MAENSALTLKRYFREYYFKHSDRIKAPSNIESREFGYFPFNGGMIRHLSFSDIGVFRALLVKEAPAGVYCSNSLYQDPMAEMQKKGWLKANLIFDIDADALKLPCKKEHDVWFCKSCGQKEFGLRPETCPNCNGLTILEMTWACPNCIEGTKKETFRLVEFLEQDFGISSSQITTFFSGNAGFHIEVGSSALDMLDQHGRSEISDYITAQGVLPSVFATSRLSPNDPGWRGRVARYIRDLPPGGEPFKSVEFEKRILEMDKELESKEIESVVASAIESNRVRIDAMVTADIHRVFRMPETLNNKTGLVKMRCADLSSFDPFTEAVALPEEKEMISIIIEMCPKVTICGNSIGPIRRKTTAKVPLYLAIYLISRGAAKIEAKKSEITESTSAQASKTDVLQAS
jgi:DNA primase small subunit